LLEFRKRHRSQNRTRPGSKILRRNVAPGYLLKIGIDIARAHIVPLTLLIQILKQMLPWQFLTLLDDFCNTPVFHL